MEKINIAVNMKATGKRISSLRKEKHIKVREITEALGLESEQAIYKWMRGESLPTVENLLRMSILLDCGIEDIIVGCTVKGGDESPFPFGECNRNHRRSA